MRHTKECSCGCLNFFASSLCPDHISPFHFYLSAEDKIIATQTLVYSRGFFSVSEFTRIGNIYRNNLQSDAKSIWIASQLSSNSKTYVRVNVEPETNITALSIADALNQKKVQIRTGLVQALGVTPDMNDPAATAQEASFLATCFNGKKDGSETDIDCGGADCTQCAGAQTCALSTDCFSGSCTDTKVCLAQVNAASAQSATSAVSIGLAVLSAVVLALQHKL